MAPLPLPRGYWLLRMILLKGPQETHDGKENIVSPKRQKGLSFEEFKRNLGSSIHNLFQKNSYSEMYDQYVSQTEGMKEDIGNQSGVDRVNQNIFRGFEDSLTKLRSLLEESLLDKILDPQTFLEKDINAKNFYKFRACTSPSLSPNCRKRPFSKSGYDYLSHFDTLVYSDNSVISAFVNFKFKTEHFRFLGSKNVVMIQIYPTDPAGYVYHTGTCDINVEKSQFKPFKHHDLETPVHWGLYSSSDYGYFNIVRPGDDRLLDELIQRPGNETAPLPPLADLKISVEEKQLTQRGEQVLQMAFDNLEELKNIFQQGSSRFSESMVDMTMSQIGDDFDRYCSNTTESSFYVRSCVCLDNRIPSLAKVRSCVQEAQKQSGVDAVRTGLNDFQAYHYGKIRTEASFLNEDPKKQYCEKPPKQLIKGYNGDIDISQDGVEFRKCVCEDSTEESLTLTMAKCFAQNQGLTVVDISKDNQFVKSLNNITAFKKYNSDLHDSIFDVQEVSSDDEDSWLPDVVVAVINWFFDDEEEENTKKKKSAWNYMNYTSAVLEGDGNVTEKLENLPPVSQMSSENLSQFIREGFNENNIHQQEEGSFLHLMLLFLV